MQEAKEGQMGPETLPGLKPNPRVEPVGLWVSPAPTDQEQPQSLQGLLSWTMPEGPSAHKRAPWQTVFAFWVMPSHAPGLLLALYAGITPRGTIWDAGPQTWNGCMQGKRPTRTRCAIAQP